MRIMDRKGNRSPSDIRRGWGPVLAADKEVSHDTLLGGGGRTHLRSASRRRNGGPCGQRKVAVTPFQLLSLHVSYYRSTTIIAS